MGAVRSLQILNLVVRFRESSRRSSRLLFFRLSRMERFGDRRCQTAHCYLPRRVVIVRRADGYPFGGLHLCDQQRIRMIAKKRIAPFERISVVTTESAEQSEPTLLPTAALGSITHKFEFRSRLSSKKRCGLFRIAPFLSLRSACGSQVREPLNRSPN